MVIDEEAASTVRQIFSWAEMGLSTYEIVRMLNELGTLPPSRYKQGKGMLNSEKSIGLYWGRAIIVNILRDTVYIGHMVQGRTRSHMGKQTRVPREEWVVVENTHVPIIGPEQFGRVQIVLEKSLKEMIGKKSPTVPHKPNFFKGKVFCGHCGFAMQYRRQNKDGVYWFRCNTQVNFSKDACVQVSIKEEDLKSAAVSMLHKYVEVLLGRKLRLCRKVAETTSVLPDTSAELTNVRRAMDRNRDTLKTLVEQLMLGELSQDAFTTKKKTNADELAALTERAIELEISPKRLESKIKECWELADCLSATECKYDLTAEILDSLVEKILVYHDKSFEIVWRFADEFVERGAAS